MQMIKKGDSLIIRRCQMCSSIIISLLFAYSFSYAENIWQKIPVIPPGQNEPNLRGATIEGFMPNGPNGSKVMVVISGAKHSGIYTLGFWVQGLSSLIPERDLWPYTGPDLGKEAFNRKMIEVVILKGKSNLKWNFPMTAISSGNFPKGTWGVRDRFLSTSIKSKSTDSSLLSNLKSGFEHGTVTIGRGVFHNKIVINFDGKNVEPCIDDLIKFVEK